MTRINLVSPQELADQHLMAEYRELPRVFSYVKKCKNKPDIPKTYCLGPGHIKFFYDKLLFLVKRHKLICDELVSRGFDIKNKDSLYDSDISSECYNNYDPTVAEIEISRGRIMDRLLEKKNFYRWTNYETK